MTGKFTFKREENNNDNSNGNVQEAINQVTEAYKKADRELKEELENKISEITTTTEAPTLSQVLSKGNEMDKDIEIIEGKKFKNFNRAEKIVYNSDDDSTNDSALDFSDEKAELSRTYESNTPERSIYSKNSIELSKDKISITSKGSLTGASGNIQSGSGGSTMTLDVTSKEIKVTLDANNVYGVENGKKEILKVDSTGVKTKKISQTVYNEPTDEKDYVPKKYVDEAVQNAGGGSRTVQWEDIGGRPTSIYPRPHPYNGTIEYSIDNIGSIMTVDPSYFAQKIEELERQIQQLQQR